MYHLLFSVWSGVNSTRTMLERSRPVEGPELHLTKIQPWFDRRIICTYNTTMINQPLKGARCESPSRETVPTVPDHRAVVANKHSWDSLQVPRPPDCLTSSPNKPNLPVDRLPSVGTRRECPGPLLRHTRHHPIGFLGVKSQIKDN